MQTNEMVHICGHMFIWALFLVFGVRNPTVKFVKLCSKHAAKINGENWWPSTDLRSEVCRGLL